MAASRLKELLEFLTVMQSQASGQSEEKQTRLLEACLRDFLAGPEIPLNEGTVMARDVQVSPIPQWMKERVVACVQDKLLKDKAGPNAEKANGKKGNGTQNNRFLTNYFTKEEWDDLCSDAKSTNSKIQVVKERFMKIGLRHPTENTFVLANAILHVASFHGPIDMMECDLNKAFDVLKDIKAIHRASLKRMVSSGLDSYPENPSDMGAELFNQAYRHGPPAQCPMDVMVIQKLADLLPARGTHSEVTRSKVRIGTTKQNAMFGQDAMMGRMMCDVFMDRFFNHQPSGGSSLQLLGPQALKRKRTQLALEDVKCEDVSNTPVKGEATQIAEGGDAKTADIDEMAASIREQLESNKGPGGKTTPPPEAKSKKVKNVKKTKVQESKDSKTKGNGKKACLKFPGTTTQGAIHLETCTVYTCPKSLNWRVKKIGEKTDKAFSWKKDKPSEVWERVVKYVSKL